MIEYARKCDFEKISSLWHEVFLDEIDYIKKFQEANPFEKHTIVYKIQEEVCGMFSLLNAYVNSQKIYYLYAGAVKPEFRNKGIYKELMKFAEEIAFSENSQIFLVPTNIELFSYYKKLGYKTISSINEESFSALEKFEKHYFYDLKSNEYNQIREEYFKKIPHVSWSEKQMEYAFWENKYSNGFAKKIKISDNFCGIVARIYEDELKILETTIPKEYYKSVFSNLAKEYSCNKIRILTQNDNNNKKDFAMALFAKEQEVYLNFALN